APPHVRHALARPGRRSSPDPGPARPQPVVDHPAIYSRRLCPTHEDLRQRTPSGTPELDMIDRDHKRSRTAGTTFHATTVLCVRHRGQVARASDQPEGAATAPSEPTPRQDCAGEAGARTAR